jgi:shikimate dehydrogenase
MISAGVLGSPISHSLSPLLHTTIYDSLGITASYKAYEVASGDLRKFLADEGSSLNCLSLTMPLKEEALTIADSVTNISLQIQSGNTLHKVDGQWSLTSTDVDGFTHALKFNERNPSGDVLVIGAGATARAVVAACDGISNKVTVVNRSTDREIAIRKSAPNLEIGFQSWSDEINFESFDLVVNTTPGNTAAVFVDQVKSVSATYFEVLYNPWPTQLLAKWRHSGGFGIDGLDLLIHQAISQASIFAARPIDRDLIAETLRSVGEKALS